MKQRVAHQRQQGARTGAGHDRIAVIVPALEIEGDRGVDDLPDRQGAAQHQQDRRDPPDDLARGRTGQDRADVDLPGPENREQGDDADQRRQRPAQQRQIAIGPLLQHGIAAQEILVDDEEALEAGPQQGQRQPGENQDQDGEAGPATEIGEAAGHVGRPGDIDRQEIDQRQHMPGMGELPAQARRGCAARPSLSCAPCRIILATCSRLCRIKAASSRDQTSPRILQRQLIGRSPAGPAGPRPGARNSRRRRARSAAWPRRRDRRPSRRRGETAEAVGAKGLSRNRQRTKAVRAITTALTMASSARRTAEPGWITATTA